MKHVEPKGTSGNAGYCVEISIIDVGSTESEPKISS